MVAQVEPIVTRKATPDAVCRVGRLAETCLHSSTHSALRKVTARYRAGTVTLHGQVPSFYLKQLAQAMVGKLAEVERVENELEVGSAKPR